ncbi:uncharacterized protein LOC109789092 [Cajanus cajan]|nr:uncharacterized protein LOC109789092 [Cajanus cajan]
MERLKTRLLELDACRQAKQKDAKALKLAEMNRKNRFENFKNASELKPVNTGLKEGEAGYDPFSRRWTRSRNYYASKPGEKAAAANNIVNGIFCGGLSAPLVLSNTRLLYRCETVLQPGFNSTVRIEKNKSKVRHKRKKTDNITQNNVVYKCHFCLHQNQKSSLEGKKRRRDSSLPKNAIKTTNMSAKEVANSTSASSKRRRKSWTSLKEIAQSNEHEKSQIANLTIPFFL